VAAILSLLEILRELAIALRHLLVAELVTILFLLQDKEQIRLPVPSNSAAICSSLA